MMMMIVIIIVVIIIIIINIIPFFTLGSIYSAKPVMGQASHRNK